ncbi:hypothetical protein ACQP1W_18205 [Spirillospora sp. CA-255316]
MGGGHAHYVIVDGREHRVWSRRHGAHTLFHDVMWGPERTIDFIQGQFGGTSDSWMNSVWWEGVALLHVRRRRMLVHTWEDVPGPRRDTSVLEIRAWLRITRALWPRWEVSWAARELFEVMDHLGLPYDTVLYLDEPPPPLRTQWAQPPTEDDDLSCVALTLVAVRDASGRLSFSGLWGAAMEGPLLAGPDVMLLPQEESIPFAVLEAVPRNGAYIDATARRLHWWSLDCPHDPRAAARTWAGWTLVDHGDAFEEVVDVIGPELLLRPPAGEEAVLRRVAGWFDQDAPAADRQTLRKALATLGLITP